MTNFITIYIIIVYYCILLHCITLYHYVKSECVFEVFNHILIKFRMEYFMLKSIKKRNVAALPPINQTPYRHHKSKKGKTLIDYLYKDNKTFFNINYLYSSNASVIGFTFVFLLLSDFKTESSALRHLMIVFVFDNKKELSILKYDDIKKNNVSLQI